MHDEPLGFLECAYNFENADSPLIKHATQYLRTQAQLCGLSWRGRTTPEALVDAWTYGTSDIGFTVHIARTDLERLSRGLGEALALKVMPDGGVALLNSKTRAQRLLSRLEGNCELESQWLPTVLASFDRPLRSTGRFQSLITWAPSTTKYTLVEEEEVCPDPPVCEPTIKCQTRIGVVQKPYVAPYPSSRDTRICISERFLPLMAQESQRDLLRKLSAALDEYSRDPAATVAGRLSENPELQPLCFQPLPCILPPDRLKHFLTYAKGETPELPNDEITFLPHFPRRDVRSFENLVRHLTNELRDEKARIAIQERKTAQALQAESHSRSVQSKTDLKPTSLSSSMVSLRSVRIMATPAEVPVKRPETVQLQPVRITMRPTLPSSTLQDCEGETRRLFGKVSHDHRSIPSSNVTRVAELCKCHRELLVTNTDNTRLQLWDKIHLTVLPPDQLFPFLSRVSEELECYPFGGLFRDMMYTLYLGQPIGLHIHTLCTAMQSYVTYKDYQLNRRVLDVDDSTWHSHKEELLYEILGKLSGSTHRTAFQLITGYCERAPERHA
ncbi:hypothetical protein GMRT_13805 [Giardia muris]|uniref:Uncharacterized protein n=1 Tax=Giardia muris TaxID=5742 RepID=A0A4Z1SS66_GIAMU|nr:hypothetical protein GMRT_13805 [Giardia muris]|eukprot:TNJ28724.1 hypothetical protein GMRT_13805 [Giardia muris]